MKKRGLKAEITVFLSLLLLVLLAFIGSVLCASRIQISKNYKRGEVEVGMNSVFAEYQIELLETYGIFALEGSYESGTYDVNKVLERLSFYGVEDVAFQVESVQLLTDNGGSAYQEQIIYYMEQKYGLDSISELLGITDLWMHQESEGASVEDKTEEETTHLAEEVALAETNLDVEENPLAYVESLRSTSILNLVIADTSQISGGSVVLEEMASQRNLQTGTGTYSYGETNLEANKLLLGEYVIEQFQYAEFTTENVENASFYAESEENTGLRYEIEYILEGNNSDIDNLESVVNKIILLRTGVNYTCLASSITKKAEADALALTIATAAGVPYLQSVIKESLLLAWAYGESIMEVKSLLQGGSLSLVKTEAEWNLELENLFTIGTQTSATQDDTNQDGMKYVDYLRMLLYLEAQENLVMRSLDVVEQTIQIGCGQEFFQVDSCISKLELMCSCQVLDGYIYEFPTYYAYR